MVRTGQEQDKIGYLHCSTLVGITHYKGDTKQRRVILMPVSLFIERETRPLSLLKGYALPVMRVSLYFYNRRCVILTCVSLLSQKRARLRY
jgi:hypothetical protein